MIKSDQNALFLLIVVSVLFSVVIRSDKVLKYDEKCERPAGLKTKTLLFLLLLFLGGIFERQKGSSVFSPRPQFFFFHFLSLSLSLSLSSTKRDSKEHSTEQPPPEQS